MNQSQRLLIRPSVFDHNIIIEYNKPLGQLPGTSSPIRIWIQIRILRAFNQMKLSRLMRSGGSMYVPTPFR